MWPADRLLVLFVRGISGLTTSTTDYMRRENSGTAVASTKTGIFPHQLYTYNSSLAIYSVCSATHEKKQITKDMFLAKDLKVNHK